MAYQYDLQASLDDIRRMQDRTREEYVRHGFARSYVIAVAVGLFVVIASRDLPHWWDSVVSLLGVGALIALAVVNGRRATVRRRAGRSEVVILVVAGVVLLGALAGFLAAAHGLGLPAPNTWAGAALALSSIVISEVTGKAYAAAVRRQDA
jgi:predicted permease